MKPVDLRSRTEMGSFTKTNNGTSPESRKSTPWGGQGGDGVRIQVIPVLASRRNVPVLPVKGKAGLRVAGGGYIDRKKGRAGGQDKQKKLSQRQSHGRKGTRPPGPWTRT